MFSIEIPIVTSIETPEEGRIWATMLKLSEAYQYNWRQDTTPKNMVFGCFLHTLNRGIKLFYRTLTGSHLVCLWHPQRTVFLYKFVLLFFVTYLLVGNSSLMLLFLLLLYQKKTTLLSRIQLCLSNKPKPWYFSGLTYNLFWHNHTSFIYFAGDCFISTVPLGLILGVMLST